MKLFRCQSCGQVLFFENTACARCGHRLGFLPDRRQLAAVEPAGDENWRTVVDTQATWRFCANAAYTVCNWLVSTAGSERFCTACRHNRMVPDLSMPMNLTAWAKLEFAKHRLFYTLLELRLPTPNRQDMPHGGLVFDFLADVTSSPGERVMTGHDEGLITLALAEADDAERELRRTTMGEPYRTLLGHFRHEVGHFYWDMLVRDGGKLDEFRAVFGDERANYAAALSRHYNQEPPADWQISYVSTYATAHPWEDWAETWAHYLHIVDGLDTAGSLGLRVHPVVDTDEVLSIEASVDPYQEADFDRLAAVWLPLTIGLNAMNQSMGLSDLYPFVLSPIVIQKLGFIHELVQNQTTQPERLAEAR